MSERYKYAKNGIYKCENFAQHGRRNRFPRVDLCTIGGIFIGWYLKCEVKRKNNQTLLSPAIFCITLPKVRLRTFFNVLKKDGSSGYMKRENTSTLYLNGYKSLGEPFDVSELLNLKNEYLDDDGALLVKYGIQCDALWDECWMFNFHDTVFNYTGEENKMVRCNHKINRDNPSKFYCSTQILNFHCPQFVEQAEKLVSSGIDYRDLLNCLQILHGVHIRTRFNEYFYILKVARSFNLANVIHYLDRPCFKGRDRFLGKKSLSFSQAINFNLRHILAAKLKDLGWEDVAKTAKNLDFEGASGEAMKIFVKILLPRFFIPDRLLVGKLEPMNQIK